MGKRLLPRQGGAGCHFVPRNDPTSPATAGFAGQAKGIFSQIVASYLQLI